MLLGDLLAEVERAGTTGNAAALLGDAALLGRVAAVAAREGVEPDAYVVAAVRRFERTAGDEDWTRLMGVAAAAADPGGACLRLMVERALAADGAA